MSSAGAAGGGLLRGHRAGVLLPIGFLLWSLVTLPDYGQVWDEPETREAAFLNLHALKAVVTHQPRPEWAGHELPGYYFSFDTMRGAFAWVISHRLHLLDDVLAFHLFNVLLSTLSVFLLYHLALAASGRRRIAVLSAAVLALFPQFLAHAQTNPKDLPGLFVFVLSIFAFVRLDRTSRWWEVLAAGLAFGLALTTTVTAVFLLPLLGLWLLATRWPLFKERWRSYLLLPIIAGIAALASWPWLWRHPIQKVTWVIARLRTFHPDLMGAGGVLYLGSVYKPWALPWHYFTVSFFVTTPILYLVFAFASLTRLRPPRERAVGTPWAAAVLGWLWCVVLVAAEARAPMRYDGIRHVLMIVPGFCLLAGIGLDRILGWIEGARPGEPVGGWRRRAAAAAATAGFGFVGVQLIRMHPYEGAYLNEVTNAWLPVRAEDLFEVEYWQQSYKEGAEWLNAHAERDARIFVAFDTRTVDLYLDREATELVDSTLPRFEDRSRPAYFLTITRSAMFPESIRHVVATYVPVFEIRRQKGTLLRIYSNRRLKSDSAGTTVRVAAVPAEGSAMGSRGTPR
jgi:hypothetical protein